MTVSGVGISNNKNEPKIVAQLFLILSALSGIIFMKIIFRIQKNKNKKRIREQSL